MIQRKVIITMDAAQVNRLVETYSDMILRISYSYLKQTYDAEDICQIVFLKLLTKDIHFDTPEHEKAYIIRATVNACKDHVKSSFFRKTVSLEDANTLAAPPVPDSEVLDALMALPKNYRVPIYLFYYEDYSAGEIGKLLGKTQGNITTCLSRGRKMLREYLQQEGELYL